MDSRETFAAAARTWVTTVGQVPDDRWDDEGLGEWDVRALVGHTSRSLLTVEGYLGQPAETEELSSAAAYYTAIAAMDLSGIAERGRVAGAALGDDPAAAVAAIADRVLAGLPDDDPLLSTAAGGMRLSSYLPTRTTELVVHTLDLVRALGTEPPDFGSEVLAEVAGVLAVSGAQQGLGPEIILALAGRSTLPDGFSVV